MSNFVIFTSHHMILINQIKGCEMGAVCGMHDNEAKYILLFG
jgi:hypothetical protein